jgi:hypothetical protein
MQRFLSHLFMVLLLSSWLSACAHQSAGQSEPADASIDCRSVTYGSAAWHHCYGKEQHQHSEVTAIFGYLIFRAVIEGIVHGLVYH